MHLAVFAEIDPELHMTGTWEVVIQTSATENLRWEVMRSSAIELGKKRGQYTINYWHQKGDKPYVYIDFDIGDWWIEGDFYHYHSRIPKSRKRGALEFSMLSDSEFEYSQVVAGKGLRFIERKIEDKRGRPGIIRNLEGVESGVFDGLEIDPKKIKPEAGIHFRVEGEETEQVGMRRVSKN